MFSAGFLSLRLVAVLPYVLDEFCDCVFSLVGPAERGLVSMRGRAVLFSLAVVFAEAQAGQERLPILLVAISAIALYRTALYTWMNWGHFWNASPASYLQLHFRTDTRIDTILVGCAFALALESDRFSSLWAWLGKSKWFPSLAMFSCIAVALYVTDEPGYGHIWRYYTYGATVAAFASGLAIVVLFMHPESWPARLLSCVPLIYLGKVSYGIYLFHPFVIRAVTRTFHPTGNGNESAPAQLAVFFSVLGASTLVAGLHFKYVETRFSQLSRMVSAPG